MSDDIEVSIEPDKKEEPVSFVEDNDTTLVTVGEKKESSGERDDQRWREAEANQARLSSDLADIRARLAGGVSAPPASYAPAADPYKAQEDAITDQERALGVQWEAYRKAGQLTRELATEFDGKARELQQRRVDISTQRAIASAMPALLQHTQQQRFQAEYGDVRGNQAANRWARGHYDMLVAQGAPESEETVREAMNAARRQFRIGNYRSAPTQQDRDQFTGFSGNAGRRNVSNKDNVVKMGKSEKIMAMAMYGEAFKGDEKKAYAQWAKGPGIRAQKAAQAARRGQSR